MLVPNQLILNKTRRHDILEYYKAKGYEVSIKGFYVKAEDLNPHSALKVKVICDYCHKEYEIIFRSYYHNVLNGNIQKCACSNCDHLKYEESMMKKYGTLVFGISEESIKKRKETCLKKYGADNPMKNPAIHQKQQETYKRNSGYNSIFELPQVREKIKNTFNQKYGVDYPLQSEDIRKKAQEAILEKYNVESPFSNKDIRNKIKGICLERYGVEEPLQSDFIQSKISQKRFETQSCKSSMVQRHLCDLFDGSLNYAIGRFNVDMLLENNIILEYDGGAHDLEVKHKRLSLEQFLEKEKKREDYLIQCGYKIIRFQNLKDLHIDDNIYLNILELCKKQLQNHDIVKYDLETMCFI